MRGLFVTGTDTGVGKSVVAAAACAVLAERGERVAAFKPVLTGLDDPAGGWPHDHALLARTANAGQAPAEVAPLRFGPPVSPHLAAELAGVEIEPARLVAAARRAAIRADAIVVEGVGGLMVPLSRDFLVRDLASLLDLPVLVVARPGLGTINHTLLTLAAAREVGLRIASSRASSRAARRGGSSGSSGGSGRCRRLRLEPAARERSTAGSPRRSPSLRFRARARRWPCRSRASRATPRSSSTPERSRRSCLRPARRLSDRRRLPRPLAQRGRRRALRSSRARAAPHLRPRGGSFVDRETRSRWDVTGRAVAGRLRGERLRRLPQRDAFWFAAAAFEPRLRVTGAAGRRSARGRRTGAEGSTACRRPRYGLRP